MALPGPVHSPHNAGVGGSSPPLATICDKGQQVYLLAFFIARPYPLPIL